VIEGVGGVEPRGRPRLFGLVLRSLEVRVYRGLGSGGYLVLCAIRVRVCRRGVGMQDHLRVAIVNSTCPVVQYFKEEGTYRNTLIGLIFVD
jgi:hypothetical protein